METYFFSFFITSMPYHYIYLLSPFQIIGGFSFSRYIIFSMYLDISYRISYFIANAMYLEKLKRCVI
jgi:hypothetical protein